LASYCFEENDIENYIHVTVTEIEPTILIQFNFNGEKIHPELITNLLDVTPIIYHSNKNILDKLSLIKKLRLITMGNLILFPMMNLPLSILNSIGTVKISGIFLYE